MPCYSPLTGYVVGKTEKGKKSIVFSKPNGKYTENIDVPCGQCIGCRLQKTQSWALRCAHEMQLHDRNCFITLTYDYPPNDYSVNKHELQKFIKRLRKAVSPKKISHFSCGEYGSESFRPHYHCMIFGYDFPDKVSTQVVPGQNPYFLSAQLSGLWPQGNHLIANATFETAAYVARYSLKKVNGEHADKRYKNLTIMDVHNVTGEILFYKEDHDVSPEFALMSRNPAIGKEWYKKYKSEVYPSDYLVHDARKIPVPKYYDKLFESEDALKFGTQKIRRRINQLLRDDKPSVARLRDIENVKQMQLNSLERNKI
jgi:hypothetical protein